MCTWQAASDASRVRRTRADGSLVRLHPTSTDVFRRLALFAFTKELWKGHCATLASWTESWNCFSLFFFLSLFFRSAASLSFDSHFASLTVGTGLPVATHCNRFLSLFRNFTGNFWIVSLLIALVLVIDDDISFRIINSVEHSLDLISICHVYLTINWVAVVRKSGILETFRHVCGSDGNAVTLLYYISDIIVMYSTL